MQRRQAVQASSLQTDDFHGFIGNHIIHNESGPVQSFDLENFLPYQLAILANRISQEFSETYRDKFGISVPEWRVIAHLSQSEKVSVREIYCKVEMDKSKVSRAAARLQKAGYIIKAANKDDRRLIELSLTTSGRAMIGEIAKLAQDFEVKILSALGDTETPRFRRSVAALLAQRK